MGFVQQGHSNYVWQNGQDKLEVVYDGEVEFTEDDADVKTLSPGGLLRIRERSALGRHEIEFRSDSSGKIERRFWVGGSEHPFVPEGRQWLAQFLPKFIRQSGIGAPARVARILKTKGPSGVLAEISLIEGSWAKRVYFTELLKTASLDAPTVRRALEQAGKEIDSDYELASLLISSADKLLVDDSTRKAYLQAATTIQSDYEMRRVFSSALKRGALASDVLAGVLETSTSIDSDYEEASLLVDIARLQPLDTRTRPAFFKAVATVGSDYERKRVLTALAAQPNLTSENASAMLELCAAMGSDYEKATVLLAVIKDQAVEGALRAPFFKAVETVNSGAERSRVLMQVAKRSDLSADTVLGIVRATQTMTGNYEAAQVLMTLAASHPISGEARDLYIARAGRLGTYEEGRALSALVKAERR